MYLYGANRFHRFLSLSGLGVSMVELRVTVDEKFNKLLDKIVELESIRVKLN